MTAAAQEPETAAAPAQWITAAQEHKTAAAQRWVLGAANWEPGAVVDRTTDSE